MKHFNRQLYMAMVAMALLVISCNEDLPEENTGDDEATEQSSKWEEQRMLIEQAGVLTKTAFTYDFEFGAPSTQGSLVYTNTYDEQGNLIDSVGNHGAKYREKLSYNADNMVIQRTLFDSAGNVLQDLKRDINEAGNETAFKYFNAYGELTYSEKRLYDEDDRLIKLTMYDSTGNDYSAVTYAYNEKGDITEVTEMVANGAVMYKSITDYNEDGWKTAASIYDATGNLVGKSIFLTHNAEGEPTSGKRYVNNGDSLVGGFEQEFDDDGNVLRYVSLNGFGNIERREEYTYDELGNRTSSASYGSIGNLIGKSIMKYDENGLLIEYTELGGGETQLNRLTWQYNEHGLLIEEIYYDRINEPLYKIGYEYTYRELQ